MCQQIKNIIELLNKNYGIIISKVFNEYSNCYENNEIRHRPLLIKTPNTDIITEKKKLCINDGWNNKINISKNDEFTDYIFAHNKHFYYVQLNNKNEISYISQEDD